MERVLPCQPICKLCLFCCVLLLYFVYGLNKPIDWYQSCILVSRFLSQKDKVLRTDDDELDQKASLQGRGFWIFFGQKPFLAEFTRSTFFQSHYSVSGMYLISVPVLGPTKFLFSVPLLVPVHSISSITRSNPQSNWKSTWNCV